MTLGRPKKKILEINFEKCYDEGTSESSSSESMNSLLDEIQNGCPHAQ